MDIRKLEGWKYPMVLLFGIGVSNVGAWVYFIALNLIILDETKSPFALSFLYIMRPLAGLLTNVWAGSLVDRVNKRALMIVLDIVRALMIILLPFAPSLWVTFLLVFVIHMASNVFGLGSFVYITKLIPADMRSRFNAINSLLVSGSFLIGPAIAGLLFLVGTPVFAIYMNAAALFVSGIVTMLMPDVEKNDGSINPSNSQPFSVFVLMNDVRLIINYYRGNLLVMTICLLFGGLMVVMASSIDSLEAAFCTLVLGLSESTYGVLVSVAGAGIITGALLNTLIVKRFSPFFLLSAGAVGHFIGYVMYAFSTSFGSAGIGFFVLAFFLSFANTGFATVYQNTIPVNAMGRIGAFNGFFESILTVAFTLAFGSLAELIPIRTVIFTGVLFMLLLSIILAFCVKVYADKSPKPSLFYTA